MKLRPMLMSASMVRAILSGTKTQTRRVVRGQLPTWESMNTEEDVTGREFAFVGGPRIETGIHKGLRPILTTVECPYGQPGDRLLCYHCAHEHYARPETDSSVTERRLHGGVGRPDLQPHEVQGIRAEGVGGLVPAAGSHDAKGLPDDLDVAQEREGHEVGAPAGLYGLSWHAANRHDGGAAPEWRCNRQQAGEPVLGNSRGELAGQAGAWAGDGWRETSGIQVHERGAGTYPLGRGTRALQPETSGPCAGCGTVVDSRNRVGGSRLWVKETYFAWGRWETRFSAKKGRDEWHFIDMTLEAGKSYLYAAEEHPQPQPMGGKRTKGGITPTWWKRPAIFMPRAASRITLEVTGVRVERLQDISRDDAIAEGVRPLVGSDGPNHWTVTTDFGSLNAPTPQHCYELLWNWINGPDSWAANPWVWVVEFKRVEA